MYLCARYNFNYSLASTRIASGTRQKIERSQLKMKYLFFALNQGCSGSGFFRTRREGASPKFPGTEMGQEGRFQPGRKREVIFL